MKIIGLTGSIAAGKSTVATWINQSGIPIHDADAVVHRLLGAAGDAVQPILDVFGPTAGSLENGINRKVVGDLVFAVPETRKQLEGILHPLVHNVRNQFLTYHLNIGTSLVVLDVPLLFETGGDVECDYVIVVHAKQETLAARALSRPGMTTEKLNGILASQMPMGEKMRRADLCLDTDLAPEITRHHLDTWLKKIKGADLVSSSSNDKKSDIENA